MTNTSKGIVTAALIFAATPLFASGNHYGWCIGVGNQHQGANCQSGGGSQTPSTTPSQVPTSNQQVQTGLGTAQTPETVTTQVIVIDPPRTFTGTSPVPQIQAQPGPTITGSNPLIVLQPLPPQVLTGTGPVTPPTPQPTPSFTGTSPIITIQPQPPQTVVGYGSVTASITVQPVPSFTGVGAVPYPQPQARPGQVPQAIPTKTPQGTPYLVPSLKGPQPTPGQAPQATPGQTPQATPVVLPRPKPRPTAQKPVATGGQTTHSPTATKTPVAAKHITSTPGRQAQHDPPQFADPEGGENWRCLASGHGQRKTFTDRRVVVSGALRHVGSIDVLGRDLPALHPGHANCIVSIKRKK